MDESTPAPQLVPTPSGGIQAEWHENGIDLEIETLSSTRFAFYFEDLESGEIEDGVIEADLTPLMPWIRRLTDAR